MMIEKIEGLETMDCQGLCEALASLERAAAEKADELEDEIRNAYTERDKAAALMHKAAESKDFKVYKDARMHFDMYVAFISKCEQDLHQVEEGSIIDSADAALIRARMNEECFKALQAAAVKIRQAREQMTAAMVEASEEISEHNHVLVRLHKCTRPKDQYGEPKAPDVFRDTVIAPYINTLSQMERYGGDPKITAFKLFAEAAAGQPDEDPEEKKPNDILQPGRPTKWNGNRWVQS